MPSTKQSWVWQCQQCQQECVPIRSQSRCICGHRLAHHDASTHACTNCKCPQFTFIVAEGAWILKCRCKHKHTDHAAAAPHSCSKATCNCAGFDSPWVCNCDHPWAQHTQRLVSKQVMQLGDMISAVQQQEHQQHLSHSQSACAPDSLSAVLTEDELTNEVNRFDKLQRGKEAATQQKQFAGSTRSQQQA